MFTLRILPIVGALIAILNSTSVFAAEDQLWSVQIVDDTAVVRVSDQTEFKFIRATLTALQESGIKKFAIRIQKPTDKIGKANRTFSIRIAEGTTEITASRDLPHKYIATTIKQLKNTGIRTMQLILADKSSVPEKVSKNPQNEPKKVAWEPSLLEGGSMFKDVQQFDDYARHAQIVAMGVLTEWDGSKGKVRLASVFHGKLKEKSVPIIATGGIVRLKLGDKVIFFLAPRDGELKLHSFCGASGIYKYSEDLALAVKKAFKSAE